MYRFSMMFKAVAFTVVSFALASVAQAQAPHTFVSALTGDDANPCSLSDPCRSIKQALSQTQPRGKVVIIDSGEYEPFVVAQAVSVEAAPGVYAGVTATVDNAVAVAAGASDVVSLRGLTLVGLGARTGVFFMSGGALHVEDCLVSGFTTDGVRAIGAGKMFVKDTTVRNNNRGIMVNVASGTAAASIDHCRLEKNTLAALEVALNARVTVRDTVAAGNGGGFRLISNVAGAASELNIENCAAVGNGMGIHSEGGRDAVAIVRVSNTTIANNERGLFSTGAVQGSILTRGNNTVEGNAVNGSFTGTFNAQ